MQIEDREYLDFSQVLIKPKPSKISSRKDVDLTNWFSFSSNKNLIGIPIISANMDTVSTIESVSVLLENNMFGVLHKHYTTQEYIDFYKGLVDKKKFNNIFHPMGISDSEFDKYYDIHMGVGKKPNVCIDIANGYIEIFVDFIKKMRSEHPNIIIMAGNVTTPEKVTELVEAGVDIVKVGLGSGANCTTRYVTGCGVPQLSAIIDCVEAARVTGGLICSDGGITCPGDVMKALGAGADFVMVGSEFAGHDESGGEYIRENGEIIGKECYGMSSGTAMKKFNDTEKTYRSSEGRTSIIPYRGPIQSTIDYYLGGLRSGMSYIGADNMREISKRTTFIKVSNILNTKYQDSTVTIR